MPISFVDPFSGAEDKTCSVAAKYASKLAHDLKAKGLLSEADWQQQIHLGTWGVIKGKLEAGLMPDVKLAEWKLHTNAVPWKIGVKNGEIVAVRLGEEVLLEIKDFEEYWVQVAGNGGGASWKWFGPYAPKESPLLGSTSVGAMTDQDVATLFVKTKDEIAKAKGINIKGANPWLDNEVFAAIAKETGYTAAEVKAKVEAYKATGKKLSSLKKKVLPKEAKKVDPVEPKKPDSKPTTLNEDGVVKDAAGAPPPEGVPTAAGQDAVDNAVQTLHAELPEYTDEQVAKAYIKAKDQIAADVNNPWTLYTQNNPEFESAIIHKMAKEYDIELTADQIKKHLADYIGGGNKLSVLKKKMAKTGEHQPVADTLKKKKGDPSTTGKTTKTQAQKEIADAAEVGYQPAGSNPFTTPDVDQTEVVFNNLKQKLFAGMQPETLYDEIAAMTKKFNDYYPNAHASMLDIVRIYDINKSKQLGIPNGFFYEKKLVEYAASPEGQAKIQAIKTAKQLEADLPPLPADSGTFQEISPTEAQRMQDGLEPWKATESSALRSYSGSSYMEMNGYLRGSGGYISDAMKRAVNNAQKGMRAMPRKLLVHRGCSFKQFGLSSYEEALGMVGKTMQEKGFLSTSVGGRAAFSGAVYLEIEVPVGTKAAFIKSISQHASENELLIAAGTKYEVLSVTKDGYQVKVRVRAIPGSESKGTL